MKSLLKLHEAIAVVLLSKENRTASFSEIAEEIENRRLYFRKDGESAPDYQIMMRTKLAKGKYHHLFEQIGKDKVRLKNCISNKNDFLSKSIFHFYQTIESYLKHSNRKDKIYSIIEYGEQTLLSFFIQGIVKNDSSNNYILAQELYIGDKNDNLKGRADLLIEDQQNNSIYFIEAKKVNTKNEDEPSSDSWKDKNEVEKYYNQVLEQANKYLQSDINNKRLIDFSHIYKVALIFDSVKFKSLKAAQKWMSYKTEIKNEFYHFKLFHFNNKFYGLACYGLIEKQVV